MIRESDPSMDPEKFGRLTDADIADVYCWPRDKDGKLEPPDRPKPRRKVDADLLEWAQFIAMAMAARIPREQVEKVREQWLAKGRKVGDS
jgi:hypothetical protein